MPTRRAGLYFQSRLLLFLQHVRLGKPLAPLGSCAHAFVYTFTPFQNVLFTGPFCLHGFPMGKRGRTVFTFVPQVTLWVDSLCLPSTRSHFRKGSPVQPAPGTAQGTQLFHGQAGRTRLQTVLTHSPDCTRVAPCRLHSTRATCAPSHQGWEQRWGEPWPYLMGETTL